MPMLESRPAFEWQLRSRTLSLGPRTLLMAIVNLTPDSFSGDGLEASREEGVAACLRAIDAGADILDIGAESTRPNATPLSSDAEQARLLPVLERVARERPGAILSVDTYHAATARAALAAGVEIVNDVSGLLWDDAMAATLAPVSCGVVLMHTRGRPTEWRSLRPLRSGQVLSTVQSGLRERLDFATAAGIAPSRIVVDPGFGFGKRGAENLELLACLDRLLTLEYPLLAGVSRKGFLGDVVDPVQTAETPTGRRSLAESRATASVAASVAAMLAGAHIIRVHDLQAAREAAAVADALLSVEASGR